MKVNIASSSYRINLGGGVYKEKPCAHVYSSLERYFQREREGGEGGKEGGEGEREGRRH